MNSPRFVLRNKRVIKKVSPAPLCTASTHVSQVSDHENRTIDETWSDMQAPLSSTSNDSQCDSIDDFFNAFDFIDDSLSHQLDCSCSCRSSKIDDISTAFNQLSIDKTEEDHLIWYFTNSTKGGYKVITLQNL